MEKGINSEHEGRLKAEFKRGLLAASIDPEKWMPRFETGLEAVKAEYEEDPNEEAYRKASEFVYRLVRVIVANVRPEIHMVFGDLKALSDWDLIRPEMPDEEISYRLKILTGLNYPIDEVKELREKGRLFHR